MSFSIISLQIFKIVSKPFDPASPAKEELVRTASLSAATIQHHESLQFHVTPQQPEEVDATLFLLSKEGNQGTEKLRTVRGHRTKSL